MCVCIYCQWLSRTETLKGNAFPAVRPVTASLLFVSIPPLCQGWPSTQSRNFVSLIPFFCVNWPSWGSGREWCLRAQAQDRPRSWFLRQGNSSLQPRLACFFSAAGGPQESVRLRHAVLWRRAVNALLCSDACSVSVILVTEPCSWLLKTSVEEGISPPLIQGPLCFSYQ